MSSELETSAAPPDGTGENAEPMFAFADALLSADRRAETRTPGEIRQFVTFFLHEEEFGIPILQCREIVRVSTITRVPEAPPHVRGVVNLRGHIVPAVDARMRLGFESAPPTAKSRLLVVEVAGRLFALIVDRVARVFKVAASDIEPVTEGAARAGVTGLARAGEAVIHLIDADRVLRAGPAAEVPTTRGEQA
jgi:purine-binding chemotaxis protein CheW